MQVWKRHRAGWGWICFGPQQQEMAETTLPGDWVLFFSKPPLAQQLIPPPTGVPREELVHFHSMVSAEKSTNPGVAGARQSQGLGLIWLPQTGLYSGVLAKRNHFALIYLLMLSLSLRFGVEWGQQREPG